MKVEELKEKQRQELKEQRWNENMEMFKRLKEEKEQILKQHYQTLISDVTDKLVNLSEQAVKDWVGSLIILCLI